MRLGWLNDYALGEHAGGSLATQLRALAYAPAEMEVVFCTPEALHTDCDFYVVNNATLFGEEQLDFIMGRPYVLWLHDLWVTPQSWQVRHGYVTRLLERAVRVAFLSEIHKRAFMMHHPATVGAKAIKLIPAMVDPAPFKRLSLDMARRNERPREAFWMGTFDRFRSPRQAMEWAEMTEAHVDFYGFGRPPAYLAGSKWCHVKGQVDAEQVPALMAEYKVCVSLPAEFGSWDDWRRPPFVDACGRVAIEAIMAGCGLVTNDRLGVTSYNWFQKGRDAVIVAMENAPLLFWRMVGAVVQRAEARNE